MNEKTANHLLDLNRQFYQTFALQFSATRQRLQPGVRRVLESVLKTNSILDIGCGNGELARELARQGYRGLYVGLDFSSELLNYARLLTSPDSSAEISHTSNQHFLQADLANPDWEKAITEITDTSFDTILAFAALHHLPGEFLRQKVLGKIHEQLDDQGQFIHSEWQFLNSPRLISRIQPWSEAGLSAADVDSGDYLLDWRRGGTGLRYVHHFTEEELWNLAAETGFKVVEGFYSDGEGGKLGLYQVWKRI